MSSPSWALDSLGDIRPQPGPTGDKASWRSWARRVRAQLDLEPISEAVVGALAGWQPLRDAVGVLLYLPLPDEVDITPLLDRLPELRYVATRTPEHGGVLTVHQLALPLEVHPFGFQQPSAVAPSVAPSVADVWLLPGLAFDGKGTRLGRGAGYFDELAGRAPDAIRVGVTPEACVVDRLPQQSHDRPVHYLATEDGVVAVAG